MTSGFLKRIILAKLIKFNEGQLMLADVPCYLWSLHVLVIMHRLLEKEFGDKGRTILFKTMETQCILAARMTQNRFGYTGLKALKMQLDQGEMVGGGKTELVKADFEKPEFIVKVYSTFAEEYVNTFGQQKHPVCDIILGAFTGLFQEQTGNKNLVCVETQCRAMGKQYCTFVIKEKSQFNIGDPFIARQMPVPFKANSKKFLTSQIGPPVRRKMKT